MSQVSATAVYRARAWSGWFAPHDVIAVGYLVLIRLLVWRTPMSAVHERMALHIDLTLVAVLAGCFVSRGLSIGSQRMRSLFYKVCMMGVGLEAYLMLRELLPLVRPDSVDATLLAIDQWIFGGEPALWLERFNVYPLVEYFSFFYFSYYLLIIGYIGTIVWTSRRPLANTELAAGSFWVLCIGHLGYMAVPGYGPVEHLADQFQAPLDGGFFWSLVWDTVQTGGAMKDIFPSLHTAFPTWFALFALRQSRIDPRWRWPAWITSFFAVNIIISTVFLRWHYVIDIFAGLLLALSAFWISKWMSRLDQRIREARGLPGAWSFEPR